MTDAYLFCILYFVFKSTSYRTGFVNYSFLLPIFIHAFEFGSLIKGGKLNFDLVIN